MLMIAVTLNLIAALGLFILASKYLFGPAPADYHRQILQADNLEITEIHSQVFWAINKALGSAYLAIAIGTTVLTIFGVLNDNLWAKALVVLMGGLVGMPSTLITYKLEKQTGIITPWRRAAGLLLVLIFAFVFSVI